MKRAILYFLWTFLCLHTTVSFSQAATSEDDIDSILANIDAMIASSESGSTDALLEDNVDTTSSTTEEDTILNSAPVSIVNTHSPIIYTPWELIHRTPMLYGYAWTGSITNYITPAMYIGTPFETNNNILGYDEDIGPTNYAECLRSEMDASFGPDGELIEETTEDELRNIAKYCAIEYLGTYFEGKDYTTREEMLMMIFKLFGEDVGMPGYFDGGKFISDGRTVETPYTNVSPHAWYAPHISLAYEYNMIENTLTWNIAEEVSDEEIRTMLENYTLGEIIETGYGDYIIQIDTARLSIQKTPGVNRILYTTPERQPTNTITKDHGTIVGFEIIAPSSAKKDELVDVTVRAIDKNGKKVTSYTGSIVFISEMFGDTVPSPGKAIKFRSEDKGELVFQRGFIFKNIGKQMIYVVDFDNSSEITGEAFINITN